MPEVIISLDGHDEELSVFGSRDQHLRQIRDALSVKVLARHGEVRIEGDRDKVDHAKLVFEQLRERHRLKRATSSSDIADIIEGILRASDPDRPRTARDPRGEPGRPSPDRRAGTLPEDLARQRTRLLRRSGRHGGRRISRLPRRSRRSGGARSRKSCSSARRSRPERSSASFPAISRPRSTPILRPLLDALHDLMEFDQLRRYMDSDLIEIAPLAYMRGRTLNDAVIILDEGQNATIPQMKMFLTRMGQNARIVVTGDVTQVDLPPGTDSGLAHAGGVVCETCRGIGAVKLDRSDIVRHPLVQAIVECVRSRDTCSGRRSERVDGGGGDESSFPSGRSQTAPPLPARLPRGEARRRRALG